MHGQRIRRIWVLEPRALFFDAKLASELAAHLDLAFLAKASAARNARADRIPLVMECALHVSLSAWKD